MVVTATASVPGTTRTQLLHVYLQNYGRYRQIKGIFDPFFEVFSIVTNYALTNNHRCVVYLPIYRCVVRHRVFKKCQRFVEWASRKKSIYGGVVWPIPSVCKFSTKRMQG